MTMITICDYKGKAKTVAIPDTWGNIDHIIVNVVSGDEVIDVLLSSGAHIKADASEERTYDFFDDSYLVTAAHIADWAKVKGVEKRSKRAAEWRE